MQDAFIEQLKRFIEQGRYEEALENFTILLLPKLIHMNQDLIQSCLTLIHPLAIHLSSSATQQLYGQIKTSLEKIDLTNIEIKISFYQKAGDTFLQLKHLKSALEYYAYALWLAEKYNCTSLIEPLLLALNRIDNACMQQQLILLWKELLPTYKEKPYNNRLLAMLCTQAPLIRYYLETHDQESIQQLYTSINPFLEKFMQWADDTLSVSSQKSIDHFTKHAEEIHKVAQELSTQQQWSLARACYYVILRYKRGQAIDFDTQYIEKEIIRLNDYLLGKQMPAAIQSMDKPLWHVWRNMLNNFRQAFAHSLALRNSIFETQKILSDHIKELIFQITNYIVTWLGDAPCGFSLLGLGSLSRGDFCPYSDVDCAIIVSDATYRHHPYFQVFIRLLQLKIQLIGEPNGFWLDEGDVCYLTDTDKWQLNTIDGFIQHYYSTQQWRHQSIQPESHALLRPTCIYANTVGQNLFSQYQQVLQKYFAQIEQGNNDLYKSWSTQHLAELKSLFKHQVTLPTLSIKHGYIRFLQLWAQNILLHQKILHCDQLTLIKTLEPYLHPKIQQLYQTILSQLQSERCTYELAHRQQMDNLPPSQVDNKQQWDVFIEWLLLFTTLDELKTKQPLPHQGLLSIQKFCLDSKLYKSNSYIEKTLQVLIDTHQADNHEILQQAYAYLSDSIDKEQLRSFFIRQLSQYSHPLVVQLAQQPNINSIRLNEALAYQQLHEQLLAITQPLLIEETHKQAKLIWFYQHKRYERCLPKKVLNKVWDDNKAEFHNHYHSRHKVIRLQQATISPSARQGFIDIQQRPLSIAVDLHIKIQPDQPLMDYAIDILHRRLIGHGTAANLLVRLEIPDSQTQLITAYPLLITPTEGEINLSQQLEQNQEDYECDHTYYTDLILVALLINSGDAASRNFACKQLASGEQILVCVDAEQQFVEPIVKKLSLNGLNVVQLRHILFCLNQASKPLNKTALERFANMQHQYQVINKWVETVMQQGEQYLQLFTAVERERLYSPSREQCFTPYFLIREGVLGKLLIDFNFLQVHIKHCLSGQTLPTALELLAFISPRVGHYYATAYTKAKYPIQRLQLATDIPQASVSSRLAIQASLGIVPTFEQIEQQKNHELVAAAKELVALLDFKPDFRKLVDTHGYPDKNRQLMMLKALALYPHSELSLSHCEVLTDKLLMEVLQKSEQRLLQLDLRSCSNITVKAIQYLSANHAALQALYLSDCSGLATFCEPGFFSQDKPILFSNLRKLHLSRCNELTKLLINAPQLEGTQLKINGCDKLVVNENVGKFPVVQKKPVDVTKESAAFFKRDKLPQSKANTNKPTLKVLLLGECGNGKSVLLKRYISGHYADGAAVPSTIGVEFESSTVMINGQEIKLVIWDTAGQERFRSLTQSYYRGVNIAMIFVDVTNSKDWWSGVNGWVYSLNKYAPENTPFILVGTKIDLIEKREISYNEALARAKEIGAERYIEISTKKGINVEEVFLAAAEIGLKHLQGWDEETNDNDNNLSLSHKLSKG